MFSNRKKIKLQGKTSAHKKSLVRSQVIELIRAERIKTTPKKAKALKSTFDRLVTVVKADPENNLLQSFFNGNEKSLIKLNKIAEQKFNDRNSGYTRVIRTLSRKGDNAEQVFVMLVNTEIEEKKSKLKKMIERKEKKAPAKDANEKKPVSKLAGALSKVTTKGPKNVGKEKTAHTLRNSK